MDSNRCFLLAINAGMINVLGLVTVLHQSVSHMTGNISMLAMSLINWEPSSVLYLILVVLCYVTGSFYSGLILGNSHFQLGRRYGLPLSLVALFIFLCWILLPYFPRYALLWACVAMGVQNAMVSHYKGTIIRTTHLSGVLTDLGLALGYCLRGLSVESVVLFFIYLFSSAFNRWYCCQSDLSLSKITVISRTGSFEFIAQHHLLVYILSS